MTIFRIGSDISYYVKNFETISKSDQGIALEKSKLMTPLESLPTSKSEIRAYTHYAQRPFTKNYYNTTLKKGCVYVWENGKAVKYTIEAYANPENRQHLLWKWAIPIFEPQDQHAVRLCDYDGSIALTLHGHAYMYKIKKKTKSKVPEFSALFLMPPRKVPRQFLLSLMLLGVLPAGWEEVRSPTY